MQKTNGIQNERLSNLETAIKDFRDEFKTFRTNEFEHLRQKVEDQDKWRIATLTTSFFTLVGIIVSLLLR